MSRRAVRLGEATMPPPPPPAQVPLIPDRIVIADRYPATITVPGGARILGARAILTRPNGRTPGWMWIWTDTRPEPTLRDCCAWTPDSDLAGLEVRRPWTVRAESGSEWVIERGRGCGCSSPLKRLAPWTPMTWGRL